MTEQEEFEFRLRFEQEQAQAKAQAQPPAPAASPSLLDRYLSWQANNVGAVVEPALQMGTGLLSSAAGGYKGLYDLLTGSDVHEAAGTITGIQHGGTYEPRTTAGKTVSRVLAAPVDIMTTSYGQLGGALGAAVAGERGRDAGESLGHSLLPVFGAVAPVAPILRNNTRAAIANRAITGAQQRAAQFAATEPMKVEAAQTAQDLGLKISPREMSDATSIRAKTSMAGADTVADAAAQANQPKYTQLIRTQIAGDPNFVPTAKNLEALSQTVAAPYREIGGSVPLLTDVAGLKQALADIKIPGDVVGMKAGKTKTAKLVQETIDALDNGMSGQGALESISVLRETARKIYNGSHPKISDTKVAARFRAVADTLENGLEQELARAGTPAELMQQFRESRSKLAQIHVVQDIADPLTGVLYPNKLTTGANATAPLTGDLAKIRLVAAHFGPEMTPAGRAGGGAVSSTSGPGAALGTAAGAVVGSPGRGRALGGLFETVGLAPWARNSLLKESTQRAVTPPRLTSPVEIPPPPPEPLGLAPVGPLPPAPAFAPPPTRGLLVGPPPRGATMLMGRTPTQLPIEHTFNPRGMMAR